MARMITVVLTLVDKADTKQTPLTLVDAVVLHPEYDARARLHRVKRSDGDISALISVKVAPWHCLDLPKSLRRRRIGSST